MRVGRPSTAVRVQHYWQRDKQLLPKPDFSLYWLTRVIYNMIHVLCKFCTPRDMGSDIKGPTPILYAKHLAVTSPKRLVPTAADKDKAMFTPCSSSSRYGPARIPPSCLPLRQHHESCCHGCFDAKRNPSMWAGRLRNKMTESLETCTDPLLR